MWNQDRLSRFLLLLLSAVLASAVLFGIAMWDAPSMVGAVVLVVAAGALTCSDPTRRHVPPALVLREK